MSTASLCAATTRWLLCAFALPAIAQTLPDAGSLQRESQRQLSAPQPQPTLPVAPAPVVQADSQQRVTARAFVLEGAQQIAPQELQAVLSPYVGQALTLAQLQQATAALERYYQSQGWYARALLPQQDVTDGRIRIEIIEARWGQSHLVPVPAGTALRANAAAVQQRITHRLQAGQPLSSADLERGLLLANDLPGIQATGLLQAGTQVGLTDLHIQVQDTPWVTADVGITNYGLRATGKAQISGGLALNNLSGQGDQLALRVLGSAHLGHALARYSAPVGYDGLRFSVWASHMRYRLAGSYDPLQAKGQASNYGLSWSYPLLRQARRSMAIEAGWLQRRLSDDMLRTPVRRHRVQVLQLGLSGSWQDPFAAGAYTWGGARWSAGRNHITDVNGDGALDAAGPRTQGQFHKLDAQISRLQNLAPQWQLLASAAGQWSNRNLPSSERMSLGGPDQVRAYPINEASGDVGLLLKLQLQRNLAPGWQAQLFYDWGSIHQYRHLWQGWNAASGQPPRYHLAGWGLGLSWQGQGPYRAWRLQASVATPTGSNAGHSQQRNSDGSSLRSTRGWLNAHYSF